MQLESTIAQPTKHQSFYANDMQTRYVIQSAFADKECKHLTLNGPFLILISIDVKNVSAVGGWSEISTACWHFKLA